MKVINRYLNTVLLCFFFFIATTLAGQEVLHLKSPDNSLIFNMTIRSGHPVYQLTSHQQVLVDWSALGFELKEHTDKPVTKLKLKKTQKLKNTYDTRGNHSKAYDRSQVYLVDIQTNGSLAYQMEIKVKDNGAAFRYIFGTARHFPLTLVNDKSQFVLPAGSIIWSQPNIHSYEGVYSAVTLDTVRPGLKAGPPLTVSLPGHDAYLAITEGGLVDYAGMSLLLTAPRTFETVLAGPVQLKDKRATTWRIIEFGKDLNDLVNNDLVTDVSRPYDPALFPKGNQTDWIKPGKSVWSWLSGNRSVTMDNMKQFVDWAAQLGIPYNLVDNGWAKWKAPGKNNWDLMRQLVAYGKKKNVGIWVWKAYPDRDGIAGLKQADQREAFFAHCHEVGVVGVKIDYFDDESQEVIRFYEAALKDAAKYHIMVDFHGADKPTGLSRTYPNEMSREGVLGLEHRTDWPPHNTILPFTRYLAGHGDYTPLSFREMIKGTTTAHQVATVALFNSSFMCLAVNPKTLMNSNVWPVVKSIPELWDQTLVLPPSKIGDMVVYARRKGKDWFLCVLNGQHKKRRIQVPLDFLKSRSYQLSYLKDDLTSKSDPAGAVTGERPVKKGAQLSIELAPGGGYIGHFEEK